MKVFVDANIFLEIQLDGKLANECVEFLRKVERGEIKAMTSDFLIYAIILAIEKFGDENKIKKFLECLPYYKGLEIVRPSLVEWIRASEIMKEYKLDFDDALILVCMEAEKLKEIVSLDKHFEKVKEVRLVSPKEI